MGAVKTFRSTTRELFSDQVVRPAQLFLKKEASSSILLLAATLASLAWANSGFFESYTHLWNTEITISFGATQISRSLIHWIDDGLMALFFFTVGLEIKREILVGELSTPKKALFPVFAAIGGMVFPGTIYALFNHGTSTSGGWGIPMATDIAFAMGAVAVFGKSLPAGLRTFLAAFAIADDLGAVFIIALFYTQQIIWSNLIVCGFFILALGIINFLWVRWTLIYVIFGIFIWLAVLGSGVHPTVAGIIVSMFIPARGKYDTDHFLQQAQKRLEAFQCAEQSCGYSILLDENHLNAVQGLEIDCHNVETPLQRMEHALHPWVAFFVLPLFALGNAGINFQGLDFFATLLQPAGIGIIIGLCIGKPVGITLFSFLAVKTGLADLPEGLSWPYIFSAAMLGGIGFTMSLFISGLSFDSFDLLNISKLAILTGSVVSAAVGIAFLLFYRAACREG